MNTTKIITSPASVLVLLLLVNCGGKEQPDQTSGAEPAKAEKAVVSELNDEQIENIVRRSYQYVAMYNVNNKFALNQGGWNTCEVDTQLQDHTTREIARPNNDTLYIGCMLDLRKDPVTLEIPAFDTEYASLMVTGYDHYVNVPLSTTKGDFKKTGKGAVL